MSEKGRNKTKKKFRKKKKIIISLYWLLLLVQPPDIMSGKNQKIQSKEKKTQLRHRAQKSEKVPFPIQSLEPVIWNWTKQKQSKSHQD